MKIIHRIAVASTPDDQKTLAMAGIKVPGHGFASFDVDEASGAWSVVREWMRRRNPSDVVRTEFSKVEINQATSLELLPNWHFGYPQPAEDFGFRKVTYDLTKWCSHCGTGLRQKAPFRMKGEPKWGSNSILQLNWIFGEYFVKPAVWENLFQPFAINSRPVVDVAGRELGTVLQLAIEGEVSISTEGLKEIRCEFCGTVKYEPMLRGPFPRLVEPLPAALVKTRQYFGSGAQADKRILVSNKLAKALTAAKVRGVSLRPVADSDRPE